VFDLAREATRPGRTLWEPAGLLPPLRAQLREPARARERLAPPLLREPELRDDDDPDRDEVERDDPERDAVERDDPDRDAAERDDPDRDAAERDDPDRDAAERERLPEPVVRLLVRDRDDRLLVERLALALELERERERRGVARWSRGISARTTSLTSRPSSASRYLAIRSSSRRMLRAS
jgi:hypothetical protein